MDEHTRHLASEWRAPGFGQWHASCDRWRVGHQLPARIPYCPLPPPHAPPPLTQSMVSPGWVIHILALKEATGKVGRPADAVAAADAAEPENAPGITTGGATVPGGVASRPPSGVLLLDRASMMSEIQLGACNPAAACRESVGGVEVGGVVRRVAAAGPTASRPLRRLRVRRKHAPERTRRRRQYRVP